eukprot:scaffold7857_cov471-Prasinococcus_capsulatus_cf.AAC.1
MSSTPIVHVDVPRIVPVPFQISATRYIRTSTAARSPVHWGELAVAPPPPLAPAACEPKGQVQRG